MKRFLIVIVACAVLSGCKPGIPKDIIQPQQMEKVLFDIHVVDGYAAGLNMPTPDSTKKIIAPLYKGVYKKYGIDSALYNQSLEYYYKHPDLLKEMYDHIVANLTKAKAKAEKAAQIVVDELPTPVDSAKASKTVQPAASETRQVQPLKLN